MIPPFLEHLPLYFTNPSLFYGKILNSPFLEKFQKLSPPYISIILKDFPLNLVSCKQHMSKDVYSNIPAIFPELSIKRLHI